MSQLNVPKNDDALWGYLENLIGFNPDNATDAERTAILAQGVALLEEKTEAKQITMQDIVDRNAAKVNVGSINVPQYLVSDIAQARTRVQGMIETRQATVDNYKNAAIAVAGALIKVAFLAAVP